MYDTGKVANINTLRPAIQTLWDYNCLNPERRLPNSIDLILALGCRDLGVAHRAAEVYQKLGSGLLVMSGEHGTYTQDVFRQTEAEMFAEVAADMGVPREQIILEPRARNTGENIRFTYDLLQQMGQSAVQSVILVQKPFIERRIQATFEAQWPGAEQMTITTTSEDLDFARYCLTKRVCPHDLTRQVVGATRRIIDYPALGYQTEQPVPNKVYDALGELESAGYGEPLALAA